MIENKGNKKRLLHTTRWSLISMINKLDSSESRQIREELFRDYWRPIHSFFLRKGLDEDTAQDLTQEFFYKTIIDNDLFSKASKDKGKFRSLLRVALNNFLISQQRYQGSSLRNPDKGLISYINLDDLESREYKCKDEEEFFNYSWIQAILENVSKRLKEKYKTSNKLFYWEAFNLRVIEPILTKQEAPCMREVCQKVGISDESKVSNYIYQVKQNFQKELRNHIREYVNTEQEVNEELTEFSQFLQRLSNN